MRWKGRRVSQNVEDRRGGAKVGGVSILGLIVAFIAWKFFGTDPQQAYQATKHMTAQIQPAETDGLDQPTQDQKEAMTFVGTVLADTEDTWANIFKIQLQAEYRAPKLVLFNREVQSSCGIAQSSMGPFYCPADYKVYIDTSFFKDMKIQMGISGERNQTELSRNDLAGDFAQAYVIAHEVGHHVQNLLGISDQVYKMRSRISQTKANQLSVRQELQADCFAGIWAHHNQKRTQFLDNGDLEEAMDAAHKIGDDYLQKRAMGQVVPDSFTHGTSAQRMKWFQTGFQTGKIAACDTFAQEI
ncbi:neutral zinc metallopeptidase [Acinetobacter equi]|uniref:Metallopeptidase n=1 Tax=Acinetobacter equi TaxID=1324350 RepID=A0A0N9VVT3_9GAMM|nr:neutral zinc metallopeptidase [Acinetobacter equi]ALH94145.1 metallopeptidase [Acinetobacter equi]